MTAMMEISPTSSPARVGQATAVEQSRAVAEVFAQVQLARQYPRDEQQARARMLRACASPRLAEKAFYEFPRSGEVVTGMTIHVAVALARCWGNLLHGLAEMSRDDGYGQSEMQAFCWDLETNERHSHTFIVPHARRAGRNNKKLDDPRDIYENNTNNGNRRWREAIFKALPIEFVEEAEWALRETLRKMAKDEGKSLEEKVEAAVTWFSGDFAVSLDQLEHMLKRPRVRWTEDDVIKLRSLGMSLKRGDLSVEDAFPRSKVTADELAPAVPTETQAAPAAASDPDVVEAEMRKQINAAGSVDELYAVFARAEQAQKAGALGVVHVEALREAAQVRKAALMPPATPEHVDHLPGAYDGNCPGCVAEAAATDRQLAGAS